MIDAIASGSHIKAKSWLDSPQPRHKNDDWSMPYSPSVEICDAKSAATPAVSHGNFRTRNARNIERGKKHNKR